MTSWWMAALGVPGVPAAVFAAAFAGLRRVARRPEATQHGWLDAVVAWTEARGALRDARAGRKNAAAELTAGKRRLKREQKAAGKPQSPPAATGGSTQAAVLAEARQVVVVADRTLKDKEEEASRRRDALAAARDKLRDCATKSCRAWRRNMLKNRRQTVKIAWQKGLKRFSDFLLAYVAGGRLLSWTDLLKPSFWTNLLNAPFWKYLLKGRNWTAASVLLTLVTLSVDLAYYNQFNHDALPFYARASLPALVSTALMMLFVIVISFGVFLLVVALLFVGIRALYWVLILAAASLAWTLLVVLSLLPLLVSRSALCTRLAVPAPAPESEAR